jgi:hypothetical protein
MDHNQRLRCRLNAARRKSRDRPSRQHLFRQTCVVDAIRGFGQLISSVQILSESASPGEAVLIYDLVMEPIGTLRIAEQCTVVDGKITFIRQVHDTATMRAAGFAPPLSS